MRGQRVAERFALEIDRHEGERRRDRDRRRGELLALPLLRGGVVHLEHAHRRTGRRPVRVRIEAGAKHHELPHAARDRGRQRIVREVRADRDERAHAAPLGLVSRLLDESVGVLAEDPHGERIGEDPAALEHLMRGAMPRGAERGAARPPGLDH